MDWKPKDWIEHPTFGVGRVSKDRGDKLDIDFVTAGPRTLLKSTELDSAAPPSPDFRFPYEKERARTRQSKAERKSKRPPLEFDHLLTCFTSHFSERFEGEAFHCSERRQKEDAAMILKDNLGRDSFEALLRARQYKEVCDIAKRVLSRTSLVYQIEKAKFTDAIDNRANQERFATTLFDLLYGSSEMEHRFASFCALLSEMNVNKWPIATYYQFLATEGKWMFMKPEVMKRMADSLNISLNYKSEPNWLTYSKLQELADRVEQELQNRGLRPRSRIDVQGFIWASIGIEQGTYVGEPTVAP
jgi:hypothetical protein